MRHPKRKGWIGWRADHCLGRMADEDGAIRTRDVADALKLSTVAVYRWLADPYFKKAGVATYNGIWFWNVEKTRLWVHAIMCLDAGAREQLGIPLDYRPRGQRTPK